MCKVQGYVAPQHGTSGKQVGRNGQSEAVGATLGGKFGVGAEGEQEVEAEGETRGVPLTFILLTFK